MDPRFKKGCFVRFRGNEFELPSVDGLSVKLDTSKFMGKVTGSISSPDGVFYYVDVPIHGMTWNVKVSEDQIMTIPEYMWFFGGGRVNEHDLGEFRAPDYMGILHVSDHSHRIDTPFQRAIEAIGKKIPSFVAPRYVLKMDLGNVYAKMPESESKPESKMTKDRCIKLLESYRAEREKVAKGRRFERCLRESVINEALECAIEL